MSRLSLCLSLLCTLSLACGDGSNDETAGSSSSGATSDTPTGEPIALDCNTYCTTITSNCTAQNAQYASMAQCETSCGAFALGTDADQMGNTLGCRIYHAGAAAGAPETHCTHAGPGGNNQCGSNCEGFCALASFACPGSFSDGEACMSACAGYPDSEPFDAADVGGDTLACRLYHLTVASEAPTVHCPHILPDSEPCGGA
ncbi:MAG TPA: hypothetical protein VGB85_22160 [Nannocystis sp.]|jgi:hypothetical protein